MRKEIIHTMATCLCVIPSHNMQYGTDNFGPLLTLDRFPKLKLMHHKNKGRSNACSARPNVSAYVKYSLFMNKLSGEAVAHSA